MAWLLVIFLAFLLALAVAGLAFLGYYGFQLHAKVAHLDIELVTQVGLVEKCNENGRKWHAYATTLKAENQRLSQWKNVADADTRATEILRTARATVERANAEASNLVATAQRQAYSLQADADQKAAAELATAKDTASAISSEAKQKAKTLRDEAQAFLNSSTTQAAKLVDAANKKAEEIAGSAYEAMKNASLYEQAIKAMKNKIEGYGDQYIIPEQSLLDDLAEDFNHTQAGQELKRARECTKIMIRNGTAAVCEYVEANRRETAINFVVDAFNGKVDSILSRAKHDNAGKLGQELRDASRRLYAGELQRKGIPRRAHHEGVPCRAG